MSWQASIEATPGKLADELAGVEAPKRKAEAEQLEGLRALVEQLVPLVSKRERVLVTFGGHTDPNGEGFDPRYVTLTVSRVDPESVRQREEAERAAAEAEEQAAAE